jgi:hypothetical protein
VPLLGLLVCCTTVTDDGKAWSAAERIDEQGVPTTLFRVALDADGAGLVLWSEASFSSGSVFFRRHTPDSGWSPNEQIDRDERDVADPELAVDPNSNVVAIWIESGPGIWSNRYTVGGGWETAVRLDSEDLGGAQDPYVAMDADGNAIAVWHQSDGARENIWASRSTPGDGWGAAEPIETDNRGHAGDPRVAIDPDGNAISVWHQSDGMRANIWANRYTPSNGWGTPERIETNDDGEARLSHVAMDPDGNAIVVWHQSDGSRFDVWSNRFTRSSGWDEAQRIDAEHTGDADSARVGVDADGHAIAVWQQFDGITVEIWCNRYVPGDGWGPAERIESIDEGDALSPRLAVSANGDAIAVWPQSDGLRYDLWSNSYTPSQGWGTAERVDPSNKGPGQPLRAEVAIDPNGSALAVWLRRDGVTFYSVSQLWAARFE